MNQIAPIDHSRIVTASIIPLVAPRTVTGSPDTIAPVDHSKIISPPLGATKQQPDQGPAPVSAIDHSKIVSAPVGQRPIDRVQNNTTPTTSVADYVARGVKAFNEENWKVAILNFEAASRHQPKNTRHLRAAAEAHFRAGDKPSALLLLARALQIASNNGKVSRNVTRRIVEMSRSGWINVFRRQRPFPVE